jgi:putative two-component system response regulator
MGSRGSVLAVDDDPGALQAIAGALGTLGYDVWQAVDGESALVLADEQQPDVILLDVNMPGMDGFEVCQQLKRRPDTQLIPVVFLTGQGGRDTRIAALDAGATDFLNKPCELTELEVRVRNLVNFRRLIEELESAERILFSIARTIEARDEGTGDHCERLAHRAVRFGHRLGFGEDDLRALNRGGYLHDLGKVGIPDAILLKPGRLSDEEIVIMRRHVEIGVAICSPLRSLRSALPIIRHHHERWDGTGYPDGLAGTDIPLLARVFQQVDIFDALTSDRCYRAAMSVDGALDVMAEETAKGWLDPNLWPEFRTMTEEDVSAAAEGIA